MKTILLGLSVCCLAFVGQKNNWFTQPVHFPKPIYIVGKNPLSKEKIVLGRALFFDPILSKDNSISCASCHSPYQAFAHTDHDLSHGIYDQIGQRNAPALFNLAWQTSFMWDGAINHLDMQALAPITHAKEMGETLPNLLLKLNKSSLYKKLAYQAYQDSTISSERLLKALAQFQLTLVSAQSKYDEVKMGKAVFNEQELKGYLLFQKNCNSCHTEPLFSSYEFANNGLTTDSTLNDTGRYAVSLNRLDSLKFKIPSLRNLSFTHPYMHDGRFKKLHQVLNHYSQGLNHSKTLDIRLQKGISLSPADKADLIAFLLTLNDKHFVFNPENQFPKEILKGNEGISN